MVRQVTPGMEIAVRLILLVALTMLAFAANSLLNRVALADASIGPALFAAVRLGSGALALAALVLSRGHGLRFATARAGDAAALALYVLGFSFAYLSLNAGIGALILFGTVQITMFLGAVLKAELLAPRRWIGAGVAFAGLAWLLWPVGVSAPPLQGSALMSAAGLGWGVYSLRGRGAKDPTAQTAANFVLATPVALVVLAVVGPGAVSAHGLALAVASGVVTSGLGYALWYAVLPRLQASAAAVAQLTVPVIAMAGGLMLLGEAPSIRAILATVLVLGGVGWSLGLGLGRRPPARPS